MTARVFTRIVAESHDSGRISILDSLWRLPARELPALRAAQA